VVNLDWKVVVNLDWKVVVNLTVFSSMPKEIIIAFNRQLLVEFRLMGKFGDEIISVFRSVIQ
jgi:hypothetical protein